jgi:hypothetical protein
MNLFRRLFGGGNTKKITFRMSQLQLVQFIALMKAQGLSYEDKPNEAAALFAITGLGYNPVNNADIVSSKRYEISMDGNNIVVAFPKGTLR